jgi:FixJ family two-component response regulator
MPNNPLMAIVDDDESMRRAKSNLLQSAGFATATFPGAEAFLGSRRRRGVACLVTDMRMPGMTGLELHQSLVASRSDISTVLMTAYADETIRLHASKAGVDSFLAKPLAPEELCECVRSGLAKRPDRRRSAHRGEGGRP